MIRTYLGTYKSVYKLKVIFKKLYNSYKSYIVKSYILHCIQECEENYDKEFASRFEEFLGKGPTASLASANNEDTPDDNFLAYVY